MQNYRVELASPVSTSFRCQKAANSLDIDAKKKSVHRLYINADIESDFNIGLILGSSGSGKTTLAKQIYGDHCFDFSYDEGQNVLDQFPQDMSYDECAEMLNGIGLTSVPCWIRPMFTLSNGQKTRAVAALQMAHCDTFVIDEWTSVVDRTVAKAMSHCIQKFARRRNKQIVLLSCHYDVLEWLNPDWVIDCNRQSYEDRRSVRRNFERSEKLEFQIREIDRTSWRYFSKYHYLSDELPGGIVTFFGLFEGDNQIGFQCFANYVPTRGNEKVKMHSNRTVIHPDYVGLGLGIKLVNATSAEMTRRGYDIWAKFSSTPMKRARDKYPHLWKLKKILRDTAVSGGNMDRDTGFRRHIKTYSYKWIGGSNVEAVLM